MTQLRPFKDRLIVWALIALFPGALVMLAVGFTSYAVHACVRALELSKDGVVAQAQVISLQTTSSLKAPTTSTIRYTYRVGERQFELERSIDESLRKRIEPGQSIEIRYRAGDPQVSDVRGNEGHWYTLAVSLLLDLALIALGWTVFRLAQRETVAKGRA
jgi:Protein of unknown function (DUF3592)